jgi:exoribonuclease-2
MLDTAPTVNSLVLYKSGPARVLEVDEKIAIELEGGKTKRVRPKDIVLLHPGPLKTLRELTPLQGELQEAWELLADQSSDLAELSELVFDEFSPCSAWAAWQLVADGLYFEGTPGRISARTPEQVQADRSAREEKADRARAWNELIERLESGRMIDEDAGPLREVERLALTQTESSRILEALGVQQTPANAWRLLTRVGYWPPAHNPYPGRFGLALDTPGGTLPELPDDPRRDLTHLDAFAIDDDDNQDPDDAVSVDGERIWVHVADVAALVGPDAPMDLEARARGANLYLPERTVPMLPDGITQRLGLGLQEISPALSFGFSLNADAEPVDLEIVPSWVRTTRISYREAATRIDQGGFRELVAATQRYRDRRLRAGAATIDLPEVNVRVTDGVVAIRELPRYVSRDMVTDAMLMAGEAASRFALANDLSIPYATQAPPDSSQRPRDLAAMYAYRRQFKPTQVRTEPDVHAGLGLGAYSRVTSPLRRYSDLLAHQQLRRFVLGAEPLARDEVAVRIGQAEVAGAATRKVERLSNTHWKMVYLGQHPGWSGRGTLVERSDQRATVLIEELALETRLRVKGDPPLNTVFDLRVREIDIPDLAAYFRITG